MLRNPAEMARAIGDLACIFPVVEQPAYLQTLALLVGRPQAAEELVVVEARRSTGRGGVALAQLLAGRAALVWPVKAADREVGKELLHATVAELRTRGIIIAQVILALDQTEQMALFQGESFLLGGELVYMSAEEDAFPAEPTTSDLQFHVVAPEDPELIRVVEATYRGSLDCPMVDGWREIPDVLAGYRSTGAYRPELWRLIRRQHETVGCLLLSDFPEYEQGELTYLGIDPQYRGLGLGLASSRWTVSFARDVGWHRVLLAVDAQNHPARRIYEEAGFAEVARRLLLARKL
jgi:ribosomal protein S18 acetylase RimI-like enzyme